MTPVKTFFFCPGPVRICVKTSCRRHRQSLNSSGVPRLFQIEGWERNKLETEGWEGCVGITTPRLAVLYGAGKKLKKPVRRSPTCELNS